MRNDYRNLNRLAKEISDKISGGLDNAGIFYRIFHRIKGPNSIASKMQEKNYSADGRKMQDVIGLRIVLYFSDDIEPVIEFLKQVFEMLDETIDEIEEFNFGPKRINLVFKIGGNNIREFRSIVGDFSIDESFEIQIRTVFSEGWHEVEHDLRYKCKEDWASHSDLSRRLNGIAATLETCDWAISGIFESLAYRAYRDRSWDQMIRNHLLIRVSSPRLSEELANFFDSDNELAKAILKIPRQKIINLFLIEGLNVPLTIDNIIHLINIAFIQKEELNKICPLELKRQLSSYQSNKMHIGESI